MIRWALKKLSYKWIRPTWIVAAILVAILHGMSAVFAYQMWMQPGSEAMLTRLGISVEWAAIYAIGLGLLPSLATALLSVADTTLALVIASWLALAVCIQIYRYLWLSAPDQRQQTKLVAFSLLFLIVIGVLEIWLEQAVTGIPASNSSGLIFYFLTQVITNLVWLVFPAALVMAILCYQLWEIDRLINRALVYTFFTLILTGIYFAGVAGLQNGFGRFMGQESPLAVVGATLVIAAIAGPLRGKLQRFIDRRFYRGGYDTERVLADADGEGVG